MFIGWVVEDHGIGMGVTADGDAGHGVGLGMGSFGGPISVMGPEAHREWLEPCFWVWFGCMGELKRGGESLSKFAWNHIHHTCHVSNGLKPKITWHLLFCQIASCHLDHLFPVALNQAIARLMACRGRNDVRVVGGEVSLDCSTE